MTSRGRLYVFEGVDGVGKTTLVDSLHRTLLSRGRECSSVSFPGRTPGSLGKVVYVLHHEPEMYDTRMVSPASMQALHVAAHIDAIDRHILPLIATGQTVVLDRFWWSMRVYGQVHGVAEESLDALTALELVHWGSLQPTAVFLIERPANSRGHSPGEHVSGLAQAYRVLASQRMAFHPVVRITNNSTIQTATSTILREIESIERDSATHT